ncbi:MAG: DUF4886 domain-containing protein [Planctomycetota bacterium]|jgi:hypothetical protein
MKTYLAVLVFLMSLCQHSAYGSKESWSPVENNSDHNKVPRNILFIGNSYVYFNDLDVVLKELAASAKPPIKLHTARLTRGGATLEMHYKDAKIKQAVSKVKWDVVILQEQSMRPVTDFERFYEYAKKWDVFLDQQNAKTAFFMTWARQHKPEMTDTLNRSYTYAGRHLDAFVAPVGLAWSLSHKSHPEIPLYDEDKSHPHSHGTYLAACVFYATLTGQSPEGLSNAGMKDVTSKQAQVLQKNAWQAVQAYTKKHTQ